MRPRDWWGVTTCARPDLPQGYLPAFLAQWNAYSNLGPVEIVDDVELEGQAKNFVRALLRGVDSGAERLHLFEDDVMACVGAFDRIAATELRAGAAFATWHSPHVPPGIRDGWQRALVEDFWGLQAVTFPRATALSLLAHQLERPWRLRNGGDLIPHKALPGAVYDRHVPCLFQHVGEVSICNPAHGLTSSRTSHTFKGKRFDARTLPVFP